MLGFMYARIYMGTFDYNLAKCNFKMPLSFKRNLEFHPSGNISLQTTTKLRRLRSNNDNSLLLLLLVVVVVVVSSV